MSIDLKSFALKYLLANMAIHARIAELVLDMTLEARWICLFL